MSLGGSDNTSDSQQQQVQNQNATSAQRTFGTGGTSSTSSSAATPGNLSQLLEGLQFARAGYTGGNGQINNAIANNMSAGNEALGTAGQGANYLNSVLSGNYLNSNPYLDATYQQGANALENSSRSAWGGQDTIPGSGGMQQAALANAQGNLATNIYGGNYANERGAQQQAAGMIPGVTGAITQAGAGQMSAAYAPLQNYLSALGSINTGQTGSGTQNLTTTKDLTNLGTSSGAGTSTGSSTQTGGGGSKGLNFL